MVKLAFERSYSRRELIYSTGAVNRLAVVLLTMCVLFVTACSENLSDAALFQRGEEFYLEGDTSSAIIELKNALRQNPNNADARFLLGNIYVDLGIGADAEKELLRAQELGVDEAEIVVPLTRAYILQNKLDEALERVELLPDLSDDARAAALTLQGDVYLRRNADALAKTVFDEALTIDQSNVEALLGKAALAVRDDDLWSARAWIEDALKADARSVAALEFLGDLEQIEGNDVEAMQAYDSAIEVDSGVQLMAHYKRALLRLRQGDPEGAADDISVMQNVAPNNAFTLYASGMALMLEAEFEQAQTAFQQALERSPDFDGAALQLGTVHYALGQDQQADQFLSRAVKAFPQEDNARIILAITRMRLNDPEGAQTVLIPVVERDPNNAIALNLLGNIYTALGDSEKSVQYLLKAVELQPENPQLRTRLAVSYLQSGDRERGIGELEGVIEIDPEFTQSELLLILQHLQDEEYEKAMEVAEQLSEKRPASMMALNLVGGTMLLQGEQDSAIEIFEQVLRTQPDNATAANSLAELAIKRGEFDLARDYYQGVLDVSPGALSATMKLAALEDALGNNEKANQLFLRAVEVHPDSASAKLSLARHLLRNGSSRQTIAIIEEIEDTHPNVPILLEVRGEAELAQGDTEKALKTLKRLVKIEPNSAEAHYLLASAYEAVGDYDQFRVSLADSLEADESLLVAQLSMIRLSVTDGDLDAAEQRLSALQERYPGHPDVYNQEGWLALRKNEYERAIEAYQTAIQISPRSSSVLMLADSQTRSGDLQQGISTLEEWVTQYPQDLVVIATLANIYGSQGEVQKSRDALEKVVALDPNNALALNALAWSLKDDNFDSALEYAESAYEIAPGVPQIADTLGVLRLRQNRTSEAIRLFEKALAGLPDNQEIQSHLNQARAEQAKNSGQ
ncbi:MAG: XrtA/PEP-CTERM system TPR-repeat protein PrsT [Pseudomonadota bacterium]